MTEGLITGYELFNANYFYSETSGYNFGGGHIALKNAAKELNGCYSYTISGSLKKGFSSIALVTNIAVYEKPDITLLYHYPEYAKVFKNLQYFKTGKPLGGTASASGNDYYTNNYALVSDFAANFSIDVNFPFATYIPVALGINVDAYQDDKDTTIEFSYYFSFSGSYYYMPLKFYNFGVSNIDILEKTLTAYNA